MVEKFRDSIHGFIHVSDDEKRIIDSKPFQRLRNIKQLALTSYVFHGAEHTRFGHSLGVMHLVSRAFIAAINECEYDFCTIKKDFYVQILRIIALTHDLGHAPFSHASEKLFANGREHEDYTIDIIMSEEISMIINDIGKKFCETNKCDEYIITPKLICDIYSGKDAGPNCEYTFLKSFMDSELDCDKMDYLLRDSYYCGVKYGMYDVDRLIESFTVYVQNGKPRLAIKSGGVQAFEEFVLARYFMFVQVYFHRTRRYFDIMLARALADVLPNGTYPENVTEYLKFDDNKAFVLMMDNIDNSQNCQNIINRIVYPRVFNTKTHPGPSDKREFDRNKKELIEKFGEKNLIIDTSADKMPHKIPKAMEVDDENAIVVYNREQNRVTTITEESHIIESLVEKIDIKSIYCNPLIKDDALSYIKDKNKK